MTTMWLAAPKIPEGKGAEWGKAAPLGLLVIVLLCLATWLLLRSMAKHLRKVRDAAEAADAAERAAAAPPSSSQGGGSDGDGGDPAGTPDVNAGDVRDSAR